MNTNLYAEEMIARLPWLKAYRQAILEVVGKAVVEEREACARIVEDSRMSSTCRCDECERIDETAAAIRARSMVPAARR